jgi:hypothetical protein
MTPNKSLQVTFDPPPIFAAAKTVVASNAPELRRSPAIALRARFAKGIRLTWVHPRFHGHLREGRCGL